jgi:tetratricopeptide (TPR) repeat protein
MADGIPFGEQSAALARELEMTEQLAQSLQDLARCYLAVEQLDKARSVLNEARPLWQELNNLPMLAENLSVDAQSLMMMARFDEAIEASEKAAAIATSIDNMWGQITARLFVGLIYIARGEVDQALDLIQKLIADAERVRHPARGLGWFYLGWMYSQLGAESKMALTAERSLESATDFPQLRSLGLALLAWRSQDDKENSEAGRELQSVAGRPGERKTLLINDLVTDLALCAIYLGQGEYEQAEQFLDALVLRLRKSDLGYFLPYALHLRSRALQATGRTSEARECLKQALEATVVIENRILQWQILVELGEVAAAEEIVQFIAGNISDPELRETFIKKWKTLARPSATST